MESFRSFARVGRRSAGGKSFGPVSLRAIASHTQFRSALMISVMVTPSFSSTSTTSPRATRRSFT